VCNNGFSQTELTQAKNIIISALKLRSDSPSNEATNIALQLQHRDRIYSKKELIKEYEKVTLSDVNLQAKQIFSKNFCITMVGSTKKMDLLKLFS
ncbi:MAG: hypothetical protein ACI4TI_02265, partial [Christensenellales bacterium]